MHGTPKQRRVFTDVAVLSKSTCMYPTNESFVSSDMGGQNNSSSPEPTILSHNHLSRFLMYDRFTSSSGSEDSAPPAFGRGSALEPNLCPPVSEGSRLGFSDTPHMYSPPNTVHHATPHRQSCSHQTTMLHGYFNFSYSLQLYWYALLPSLCSAMHRARRKEETKFSLV